MAVFIRYKNTEYNLEMLTQVSCEEDEDYETIYLSFQNESQNTILKQFKDSYGHDEEMDKFIEIVKRYISHNRWEYL